MDSINIADFETENLMATFKFRLAEWTLSQYGMMGQLLDNEKNCLKDKCLSDPIDDYDEFRKCVVNCETGQREVLTMQEKHAEVARLTYAKNISRCTNIHGNVPTESEQEGFDEEADDSLNAVGLVRCISHNTDKVDRRFFGYYSTQRTNLVNKYSYSSIL